MYSWSKHAKCSHLSHPIWEIWVFPVLFFQLFYAFEIFHNKILGENLLLIQKIKKMVLHFKNLHYIHLFVQQILIQYCVCHPVSWSNLIEHTIWHFFGVGFYLLIIYSLFTLSFSLNLEF